MELHLPLWVPRAGRYVVVVEYSTEAEQPSVADVRVGSPGLGLAGQVTIYSCQSRYRSCLGVPLVRPAGDQLRGLVFIGMESGSFLRLLSAA